MSQPIPLHPTPRTENPLERWRKDPYRLLFPLGALLLIAGVFPWARFGLTGQGYSPTFHALVQVQSFLTAFAAGFLFTFIPRRTGSASPSALQVCLGASLPVLIAVAAALEAWTAAQLLWLAMVCTLGHFVLSRVRPKGLDAGLVWVPLSFVMGVTGSLLLAFGPRLSWMWSHGTGMALLTQGMFTGLCLGIGRMLFPIMLHGRPPQAPAPRRAFAWNAAAGALFFGTFFLEVAGAARAAWAIRAVLTGVLVVHGMKGLTPPSQPGLNRRVLWLSAWAIPSGYALMAVFPAQRLAGLHVLFIGGFTAMIVAVSTHVVLAHGGFGKVLAGKPPELLAALPLLAFALLARIAMAVDPGRLQVWSAIAALSFLAAMVPWLLLLARGLWSKPVRE